MTESRIPNLTRIDHCSDAGTWTLFRRPPSRPLIPYVREIQGYFEVGGRPVVRKEVPTGMIPLIVVIGPAFTLHDPSGRERPRKLDRSFVAGLHEVPTLVGSAGGAVCLQVDLTPLGARRLLGLDMHEIAGRVVDLHALLARAVDELEERLADAAGWSLRFELLDRFLCARILGGRTTTPLVEAAWTTLERTGGEVRIGALAHALGCSRKHLVSLFKREVGLPPKSVARVLRFERAMAQLGAGAFGSLAELAAACGYADQSHFNRDFHAFAGESPTALVPKILDDKTGILTELR